MRSRNEGRSQILSKMWSAHHWRSQKKERTWKRAPEVVGMSFPSPKVLRTFIVKWCDVERRHMVYCTKCGTENEDDATTCINCGASLKPQAYIHRRARDENDWCFGSRGSQTWPILIGVFIILVGVSQLLDDVAWWARWDYIWPFFVIVIGLLIVYNQLRK